MPAHVSCDECGEVLIPGDWPWCPHGRTLRTHHSIHVRERTVVFRHPETGHVVYPGRNDVPIPTRYVDQGYQRHELGSLRTLQKFEKENNVSSEVANYDQNSGNAIDNPDAPGLPKETIDLLKSGKISIGTG